MTEYGDLFSVSAAANVYYALNFGFMVAYGVVVALVIPATSYLTIRENPLSGSVASAA
jgi:hypothetical protein